MPYKDAAKSRAWNLEYQRKRQRLARSEEVDIETEVLALIREQPSVWSAPTLYDHLQKTFPGKVRYGDVQKALSTLLGGEFGGLIQFDRACRIDRGVYTFKPVNIPGVPIAPRAVSSESQAAVA